MNQTAASLPYGVSEFEAAGIEAQPSQMVAPPRVAGAPVALECRLEQIVHLPTSAMVIGRVVAAHVDPSIYHNGYVLMDHYHPVGRMAGEQYVRCRDSFSLERPR